MNKYILFPNYLKNRKIFQYNSFMKFVNKNQVSISRKNVINNKLRLQNNFKFVIRKTYVYNYFVLKQIYSLLHNKSRSIRKLLIICGLLSSVFLYYCYKKQEINSKVDLTFKNIIIQKILQKEYIINKISWEIFQLCNKESINRLLANLIINDVLPNESIRNDLYRIIKRETINYIQGQECRRLLRELIIKEVLRNEDIRSDLYSLIKQFITLREINFLEDKLERILIDILAIDGIHKHVAEKINNETQKALRDENLIRMAVNLISDKFK